MKRPAQPAKLMYRRARSPKNLIATSLACVVIPKRIWTGAVTAPPIRFLALGFVSRQLDRAGGARTALNLSELLYHPLFEFM